MLPRADTLLGNVAKILTLSEGMLPSADTLSGNVARVWTLSLDGARL